MRMQRLVVVALAAAVALGGCSKKEEPVAEAPKAEAPTVPAPGQEPQMPASHPPVGGQEGAAGMGAMGSSAPRQVTVPEEVENTWKAVVLEVTDKDENTSQSVTVDIGETINVGDLEITVMNFLPAFTMSGEQITSKSNETENPAAQLVVKESGDEVFSGWLFTMFPEAHPFQHEKYGVLLKDFVKK